MLSSYLKLPLIATLLRKVSLAICLVTLTSCASVGFKDFFLGYSQQLKPARMAIAQGDISKAKTLTSILNPRHNSYALSLLENGRVNYLASDFKTSKQVLAKADKKITEDDDKASIQISRGVQKLAALASNDSAIPYEVPYYEKSMLHTYQALNYLHGGDIEGALVEVRRANIIQTQALKAYEKEIFQAKDEMSETGLDFDKVNGAYPSMLDIIGDVKNGFQNAYTFYLSGVLYEASGEPNDAYIDYKKALEIYPNNSYLQQDILRLATQLDMQDDLGRFEQKYGKYQASEQRQQGDVVFLYEEGLVNAKSDISLNLPISTGGGDLRFFSFSLPVYKSSSNHTGSLNVDIESDNYTSQEIVKIQSLAAKNLEEQLPSLLTRQALRLVSKEQVRKQAAKNAGDVGNILASLYNYASEKADTRSWSMLPARVGIIRLKMASGEHNLTLNVAGSKIPVTIKVNPNRITLINISAIGNYTHHQILNL